VGLKDLFSSSGRSKNRLDRHMRAVVNQYGQSPSATTRCRSCWTSAPSRPSSALMRRFTINSSKSIEDEEEKNWLSKRLTDLDKALMLSAAREFCLNNDNIAWVLRIVEDRANEREEWELFDALLEKHPPVYERDPSKKKQLLSHIADIDNPRVAAILIKYLADPDETVRFQVVDSLLDIADEQEARPRPAGRAHRPPRRPRRGLPAPAHQDPHRPRPPQVGPLRLPERIQQNLGNEHTFDGTRIKER
jgi:hypothetical protein